MELEHQGIISDGVRKEVRMTMSGREQNQLLHLHLKKSCTKEALLKACTIMIEEEGNPKMKQFGKDLEKGKRLSEHRVHIM